MTNIHQDLEAQIPRLRRYARSLVRDISAADDLVQDTLVRGLAKLHLWQRGTDLRAWLFTILHNQHVNVVRRQVRIGTAVSVKDIALPGELPNQEQGLELRDLDRALGQLPEGHRAVVLMVGLEGMAYADVAKVLGIPVGTVRSRLSRGRNILRRLMTAERGKREVVVTRPRRHDAPPPTPPALALVLVA